MSDDTSAVPAQSEQQPEPAQPETPAAAEKQQTFDADYVAKLRAENARYRTEAKANSDAAKKLADIEEANKSEAQKQAEALQRLQQENAALRLSTIKAQVAAEKGVPMDLLHGSSAEELQASADALLAFRGNAAPPTPDFGAGDRGDGPAKPKQLNRADLARMTPDQIVAADAAGQLDDLKSGRH